MTIVEKVKNTYLVVIMYIYKLTTYFSTIRNFKLLNRYHQKVVANRFAALLLIRIGNDTNSFYTFFICFSLIFLALSFRITCMGIATPKARDIMINKVFTPLFTVSESIVL